MTANFADWLGICEAKARYCRMLDTKQWDDWAECMADDVATVSYTHLTLPTKRIV